MPIRNNIVKLKEDYEASLATIDAEIDKEHSIISVRRMRLQILRIMQKAVKSDSMGLVEVLKNIDGMPEFEKIDETNIEEKIQEKIQERQGA